MITSKYYEALLRFKLYFSTVHSEFFGTNGNLVNFVEFRELQWKFV